MYNVRQIIQTTTGILERAQVAGSVLLAVYDRLFTTMTTDYLGQRSFIDSLHTILLHAWHLYFKLAYHIVLINYKIYTYADHLQTCHCIRVMMWRNEQRKSNEIPYLLALPSSLLAGSFCYLGLRMLALFSYACLSRVNFRFLAPLSGRGMYGHETQRVSRAAVR